jgi:hypothetical protein
MEGYVGRAHTDTHKKEVIHQLSVPSAECAILINNAVQMKQA